MNIGIDHGYYAIKTRHFSFPAGIAVYSHEPYTLQNTLEYGGKFFVCGTGRQPILRNKMENDNYYLLTLAAGLPLAGFGREKNLSGSTFSVLPSSCALSLKERRTKSPSRM